MLQNTVSTIVSDWHVILSKCIMPIMFHVCADFFMSAAVLYQAVCGMRRYPLRSGCGYQPLLECWFLCRYSLRPLFALPFQASLTLLSIMASSLIHLYPPIGPSFSHTLCRCEFIRPFSSLRPFLVSASHQPSLQLSRCSFIRA